MYCFFARLFAEEKDHLPPIRQAITMCGQACIRLDRFALAERILEADLLSCHASHRRLRKLTCLTLADNDSHTIQRRYVQWEEALAQKA